MVTIRITGKIAKRLKSSPDAGAPLSSGLLGDWYANLLIIQRQHLLLAVSARTLLPVLMPAKDLASLPVRLRSAVVGMLRQIGIPETKINGELAGMNDYVLAKTVSRTILGSMTDFANMLEYTFDSSSLELQALELAKSPCRPIGMDSPIEATAKVFGERPPRWNLDFEPLGDLP